MKTEWLERMRSMSKEFYIRDNTLIRYFGDGGDVIIPDGVETIHHGAFSNRRTVTGVEIPEGVKVIEEKAFEGCENLEAVSIPSSVATIGKGAFFGCKNLARLTIRAGVERIESIAFACCSSLTHLKIPHTVKEIECYAFAACEGLTHVEIPNSVHVWYENFRESRALADENGFIVIHDVLLGYCGPGGVVQIPSNVKCIESMAFLNQDAITGVEIPEGVTSIKRHAFLGCKELKRVVIPKSMKTIEADAFQGCTSLSEAVIMSDDVDVTAASFKGCTKLVDPDGFLIAGTWLLRYSGHDSIVKIPAGVRHIGAAAFFGNKGVTEVMFPEGLLSIETAAFLGCTGLEDVTLPNGLIRLGGLIFVYGNQKLRVTVPASVSDIDSHFAIIDTNENKCAVLCGKKGSAVAKYAEEMGLEFHEMQFPA